MGPRYQPPCLDLNLSRPRRAHLLPSKVPSHHSIPLSSTLLQSSPNPEEQYERKVVGGPITLPLPGPGLLLLAPAYAVHSVSEILVVLYFCKMHSWSGLCPAHGWLIK